MLLQDPSLCAKLFCLLSCEQASRLLKLTAEETAPELVLPKGTAAPDHVAALVGNDAYLTIFQKWVRSLATTATASTTAVASTSAAAAKRPAKKAKASAGGGGGEDHGGALACGFMVDFLVSVKAMRCEADPAELRSAAARIVESFVAPKADRALACLDSAMRSGIVATIATNSAVGGGAAGSAGISKGKKGKGSAAISPSASGGTPALLRKSFDAAVAVVTSALHEASFTRFLSSSHYSYVMSLKLKETRTPSMDEFRAIRVLGEGGFGQVLEVVKRDCGKRYAMKVQRKAELAADLANDPMGWEAVVKLVAVQRFKHTRVAAYAVQPARRSLLSATYPDSSAVRAAAVQRSATSK